MTKPHPSLCNRPKPKTQPQRPAKVHPIFGRLEYINRDGGWWQSTVPMADRPTRVKLVQRARLSDDVIDSAACFLSWILKNQQQVRAHLGRELSNGVYRSNMEKHPCDKLADSSLLEAIYPCEIVLYNDFAELAYECFSLPEGKLFGADRIAVTIDSSKVPTSVFLSELGLHDRAQGILELPLPADLSHFEESLADQFVARAAEWGWFDFDDQLQELLDGAIRSVEEQMRTTSEESAEYLRRVLLLLKDIPREADDDLDGVDELDELDE